MSKWTKVWVPFQCLLYVGIFTMCVIYREDIMAEYRKQSESYHTTDKDDILEMIKYLQSDLDMNGHSRVDHKNVEHRYVFLGHHEEMETLSMAEQFKILENIFHKIDVNSDGYIVRREISKWIQTKIEEHVSDDIDKNRIIFLELDSDKDGSLTWKEFKNGYFLAKGYSADELKDYTPFLYSDDSKKMLRYQFRWVGVEEVKIDARADPNDKNYNVDEFQYFRHPKTSKKWLRAMARQMIEQQDENNDGKLTKDEFARFEKQDAPINEYITKQRQEFKDIVDINNDGFADEKEMMAYYDPLGVKHANDEADKIMFAVDTNKDLKVSLEEIMENKDIVVVKKVDDSKRIFHDEF